MNIDEHEYEKLLRRVAKLDALEQGGVDNWEHYDVSLASWRKDEEIEGAYVDALNAISDLMSEAEVDYPAGREAGSRITYDEAGMRRILLNFLSQINEIKTAL